MSLQNPSFIPGPTNLPEGLRKACDMPTIDHRSPLFGEILRPARSGVRRVLKSQRAEVFIFPSTGTGGWEAALSNTLKAGDTVLAARNGMFSHRWIDMCRRHGLNVEVVETPWGQGIPAYRFEEILTADTQHRIRAVLATHNETATGVRSDIHAVRRAMNAAGHPAMLFVDGVSSIGSMDFRFDEWGVDIAVTGSQKGFMLPAGLAILGVSPKAMSATKGGETLPRTFFDFRDMQRAYGQDAYPYTPCVGLINGLNLSCRMLLDEGLDNVFARHARIASGVRAATGAWGLPLCAASPDLMSDTVSTIRTPEGFDATELVRHAAQTYGVAFGVGLGELAGKVFRIGHLGSLTEVMMLSGIATMEMCMADFGLNITLGSGVAAAQDFYRKHPATIAREVA
ncbi:aminotransferase class V-fold PLP-dependent enzyme [Citreicella sp. C3M06]|uniref:L-aspartate--glyoxylate aminotransferase BhcA n=1 Tax=Citreicella sp. C3M06 TaxID=2841564 RepID=UPI001C094877|nr:L-aspartate--glyoxylate aminotransferase BhcA [Citreicella sp. C3M06]MBU2960734.1 aminotransferase class V-fold PLP-dependent enzyme [Citreicella sp. C3M06]